jgi:hypothetical protein
MAQTGGWIHSSDASRIGNVTGIKPEDWEGEPSLAPPPPTPPTTRADLRSLIVELPKSARTRGDR